VWTVCWNFVKFLHAPIPKKGLYSTNQPSLVPVFWNDFYTFVSNRRWAGLNYFLGTHVFFVFTSNSIRLRKTNNYFTRTTVVMLRCCYLSASLGWELHTLLWISWRIESDYQLNSVTTLLASLHDQNKSSFFGGPAFIHQIRTIWKVFKQPWLAKKSHFCFDHVNRLSIHKNWSISYGKGLNTHLFVKVRRPGDSEVTFSGLRVKLPPVTTSLTTQR